MAKLCALRAVQPHQPLQCEERVKRPVGQLRASVKTRLDAMAVSNNLGHVRSLLLRVPPF
jgi:hypothetical protein